MAKGAVGGLVALVVLLIGGIIGLTITDAVVTDTVHLDGYVNESHTLTCGCNESSYETVTLNSIPMATTAQGGRTVTLMNSYGNFTLVSGTNYDILSYTSGTINITDYETATNGTAIYMTYDYVPTTWFDSSLSRTIVVYIVPIGLLGLLAVAALAVRI